MSSPQIQVEVNGTPVSFAVQPRLCSGRVLAPVRDLAAALGAAVVWAPAGKKITVTKASTELELTLDSEYAAVNGASVELPGTIRSRAGKAMAPVRFVAENLGFLVDWQQGKVHISGQ